jgi:hypothetical protein
MIFRNQEWRRLAILYCAGLLGLHAIWMIFPEVLVRTKWSSQNRPAVESLARLGLLRGDLWPDFALSYSELAWPPEGTAQPPRQDLERAQDIAKRALRGSPHDARLWLLLAALDMQIAQLEHQQSKEAVDALKMAYYTAPNEAKLSPYRLMLAVRPGVLADEELRQLMLSELRTLLTREPQFKPVIVAAYRKASPTAKRLIENAVNGQEPDLLPPAQPEAGPR